MTTMAHPPRVIVGTPRAPGAGDRRFQTQRAPKCIMALAPRSANLNRSKVDSQAQR
jgi:hypothetical protein